MTRKYQLLLAAGVAILSVAPVLGALAQVRTTEGPFFAGYSSPGEFRITVEGDTPIGNYAVGSSFQTFCVEVNEYCWTPGSGSVYEWVLNDRAINGGVGGAVGGEDPLDARTAYLYTQFTNGTLSNYDFANTLSQRVSDGVALQQAIQHIEQEITSVSGKAATWVNEASLAVSSGAWVGLGNVRLLNLCDLDNSDPVAEYFGGSDSTYTTLRQDVLVTIPEPATIAMLLIGGLMLRKRSA